MFSRADYDVVNSQIENFLWYEIFNLNEVEENIDTCYDILYNINFNTVPKKQIKLGNMITL